MHPFNHKTVFLLDHTPFFRTSCESIVEFDLTKTRGPGFIPLAPIHKSLWTCCVESATEYCRIVWDLFPIGKLIRFIASDITAHSLNTWNQSQQNVSHLLNGLAQVGVPPAATQDNSKFSIFPGLIAAVQAMCECSEQQHEKRTSLNENTIQVVNRCRVICITSFVSNDISRIIEDRLQQDIIRGNKIAVASDLLIPVDACELVVLNVHSNGCTMEDIPKHKVSTILESETYHVKASGGLANKLSSLILAHYNLASTTVTGIPMKEEQNASSSANYDVEIYHPAEAHDALFRGCGVDIMSLMTTKEGFDYSTITLKWCTPRGLSNNELYICSSVHRITPVDINSRPSLCLINFLLGGRSVMLEVSRRGGAKALSHLLAARGGQIYMHSLTIGRSPLEDPPSISEGAGGRVTDYRITDFGTFMQQNKLFPLKSGKVQGTTFKRTRARLERHTKFWPMTISSTTIFNYKQYLEPILTLMLQPELRDSDVIQCKQCIYSLVGNEAKHEPLTSTGQRSKGPKREEQYKQMWTELEAFLRAHCITDKHINILNCLLEVRSRDLSSDGDKVELDQALRELDQLSSERASVIRATTDSPLSPDAAVPVVRKTVLELWLEKFAPKNTRPEFVGLSSAQITPNGKMKFKLYANLNRTKSFARPRKDTEFS
uniref:Protein asunder n=1 Tax=Triatoma infestans TaxID=30076 RepID=A0A023F199_TRIIF